MIYKYQERRINLIVFILLLVSLTLFACTPTNAEPTETQAVPTQPEVITSPSATPLEPTEETTPVLPQSKVVLITPPGSDQALAEHTSTILAELAESEGLEYEQRASFSPGEPMAEIRVMAAIPPDPGLVQLAQDSPATQFLGITIPGLEPAANLTIIDDQQSTPDKIGFLAGYLAAVATPEWRVGVISSSDSETGIAQRQGFLNGVVFFCGLCRQTYPPYNTYPMFAEGPTNSDSSEWLVLADTLINNAVQTVYIPPGVGNQALIDHLVAADVHLIGTSSPLLGVEDHWIATITGDINGAIKNAWPGLMEGKGGESIPAALSFTEPNYNLFSPGRQHLVEKMLADLSAGFIDTGITNSP